MAVRLVSLRLPSGEWEVLATSLLEEGDYPTEEFLAVYHRRWGHETFHLMRKGRLELENFSGQTEEAVAQDVQAALLLANWESVLSEPTQAALTQQGRPEAQARQVNRANSYHALKDQVLGEALRGPWSTAPGRPNLNLRAIRPGRPHTSSTCHYPGPLQTRFRFRLCRRRSSTANLFGGVEPRNAVIPDANTILLYSTPIND